MAALKEVKATIVLNETRDQTVLFRRADGTRVLRVKFHRVGTESYVSLLARNSNTGHMVLKWVTVVEWNGGMDGSRGDILFEEYMAALTALDRHCPGNPYRHICFSD